MRYYNFEIAYLKYFVGTNGILVTTAFLGFPRTLTWTSVPGFLYSAGTYPIAMFSLRVGDGPPEVTIPISSPSSDRIGASSTQSVRSNEEKTSSRGTFNNQAYSSTKSLLLLQVRLDIFISEISCSVFGY